MALITVKELGALTAEDAGKRITDGSGMFGMVRTTRQAKMPISVDFEWRFKLNGRSRQVRIGSWPKTSLKALRDTRDKLAAEVKSGSDPIERRAAERLKRAADSIEAVQVQRDRLQAIAGKQARLTVRELFDLWQTLALRHRSPQGVRAGCLSPNRGDGSGRREQSPHSGHRRHHDGQKRRAYGQARLI